MSLVTRTPVLGFAAFSGTGKTTLLRRVIPLLRKKGLRLGLIKHGHHGFEVDTQGKDSYVLRRAGAMQMLVASAQRTVLIQDHPAGDHPSLPDFIRTLDDGNLDLILVEGFKYQPIPKIELHRPSLGHPLLCHDDPAVIAVATDRPLADVGGIAQLDLNDPRGIVDFIRKRLLLDPGSRRFASAPRTR
jgi:molybdopterin-guanine dinucleotide biosynthesis protein B